MNRATFLLRSSVLALAAMGINQASGQLFSDNFNYGTPTTNSAAGYTVNRANSDSRAIFGYDYSSSSLGIPVAPNTLDGSKLGLRLDANITGGALTSLVISPSATFAGNFVMTFDLWMNSAGAFPAGGTGSTEAFTAGVGYNGTAFHNNTSGSGVWFAAMGDGGFTGTSATPDYQARIGSTLQGPASGVYAAGTATGASGASVDNANAYYTTRFPGQTPPAGQLDLSANQTGTAANGSLIFAWHQVTVSRIDGTARFLIDGNLIATVTDAAVNATDAVEIGWWDPANSIDNGLVFGIVDNLKVVPEPSTYALAALGLAGGWMMRRRLKA